MKNVFGLALILVGLIGCSKSEFSSNSVSRDNKKKEELPDPNCGPRDHLRQGLNVDVNVILDDITSKGSCSALNKFEFLGNSELTRQAASFQVHQGNLSIGVSKNENNELVLQQGGESIELQDDQSGDAITCAQFRWHGSISKESFDNGMILMAAVSKVPVSLKVNGEKIFEDEKFGAFRAVCPMAVVDLVNNDVVEWDFSMIRDLKSTQEVAHVMWRKLKQGETFEMAMAECHKAGGSIDELHEIGYIVASAKQFIPGEIDKPECKIKF